VHDDGLGRALQGDLVAAGYEHDPVATMIHSGADVEPATIAVQSVSLDALRPALIRDWKVVIPDATDEHLRQLADRTALSARGAELTILAVHEGDEIAAHADLFIDRVERIAQFENLVTHADFRGRGYGDALLRDALRRAHDAGAELSFLTAGLDDWPYAWYRRMGYVDRGHTHHFSRH
jgi:GNAT superfamily N-acetyltransferase